jgi:cell division septation protein DedD
MWTPSVSVLAVVLGLNAVGIQAQDEVVCDTRQTRDAASLSASDTAEAFQRTMDDHIHSACQNGFKSEEERQFSSHQAGPLVLTITATDDFPPNTDCGANFDRIIEQCIINENLWGGTVLTDGILYEIHKSDISGNTLSGLPLVERDSSNVDIVSGRAVRPKKAAKTKPKSKPAKAKKPATSPTKTKPKPASTPKTKPKPKPSPTPKACAFKPRKGTKGGRLASRTDTCDQGIPTVAEIKKQLKPTKNNCVFYSGPGGYSAKAQQWANKKKNGYRTLSALWLDQDWRDPYVKTPTNAEIFNGRASEAMARSCSGTVYVMLPTDTKGLNWRKGTVWDKDEYPNLSSAVTKLIRINPENDDEEVLKG